MSENGSNYDEREQRSAQRINTLFSIALVVLIAIALVNTYNRWVNLEEDVNLARSNVETMMQRRLELIPDLVETVKAYSKHEEEVFEDIANARVALAYLLGNAESDVDEISDANLELTKQINNLIAIAEDYPDLTSGEHYLSLMDQIEGSANRIAIEREKYNQKVSIYNKAIRKFPDSIVARIFGFKEIKPFEANREAHRTTNVVNFR